MAGYDSRRRERILNKYGVLIRLLKQAPKTLDEIYHHITNKNKIKVSPRTLERRLDDLIFLGLVVKKNSKYFWKDYLDTLLTQHEKHVKDEEASFSIEVTVVEVKTDFDPYGGEYTHISLGYRLPEVYPPEVEKMYPLPPKRIVYKHALHIIIPRDKWHGQYTMWQRYKLSVDDDGKIILEKLD